MTNNERKVLILKNDPTLINILKDIRIREIEANNSNTYIVRSIYQPPNVFVRAILTPQDWLDLSKESWFSKGGLLYFDPIDNADPICFAWKEANQTSFLINGEQATDEQRFSYWNR